MDAHTFVTPDEQSSSFLSDITLEFLHLDAPDQYELRLRLRVDETRVDDLPTGVLIRLGDLTLRMPKPIAKRLQERLEAIPDSTPEESK